MTCSLQLHWGAPKADAHPLLVIKLGQATRECNGEQLDEFAEAIISQVQLAMESKFSDEPGQPEQMVVLADCAGASSLQVRNAPVSHCKAEMPDIDSVSSWTVVERIPAILWMHTQWSEQRLAHEYANDVT